MPSFQKKVSRQNGRRSARQGRTILFVSHNMNAVERLCGRMIHLESGSLAGAYNDVRQGVIAYLRGVDGSPAATVWEHGGECKNEYFVPQRFEVFSSEPEARADEPFSNLYPIQISVIGIVHRPDPALNVAIALYSEQGELLFQSYTSDQEEDRWPSLRVGPVRLRVFIPARLLNEGSYRIELWASLQYRAWLIEPARNAPSVTFAIQGGLSNSPYWHHKRAGLLAPVLAWDTY